LEQISKNPLQADENNFQMGQNKGPIVVKNGDVNWGPMDSRPREFLLLVNSIMEW